MIDALCHRTCVQELDVFGIAVTIADEERFLDRYGREVDSKIHTLSIGGSKFHYNQSASCFLVKFLSRLPHLTDLKIHSCSLHDDFYKEIVDKASSSKIQTVKLDFKVDYYKHAEPLGHLASKQLAKFLCSLPCLTTLTMEGNLSFVHDDFFTELGSLAASSEMQTVNLDFNLNYDMPAEVLSRSASKQLARFLCSLPCLITLVIVGDIYLRDDFFTELAYLAASSQLSFQNTYVREKKHIRMLKEWSQRKYHQQKLVDH
eukprot:XP_011662728.1 PREDICTED: uncharacterized protein LOC105437621 [Strongylocentrotus purpuratus]